jgi:N-alpha-acetyl-L-2,4-diaminobutyrate deacetylase
MTSERSMVGTTVDYAAEGKQYGHLLVPHSRNESAWGTLMLPIVCIKGGDGPTMLLTAGNHGDGYEGPMPARRAD